MLPCTDDNPCGGGGGGTGGGGGGTGGGGGGGGEEPSPGGAAPQGPIGSNQTTTGIQLNYRINKIKVSFRKLGFGAIRSFNTSMD